MAQLFLLALLTSLTVLIQQCTAGCPTNGPYHIKSNTTGNYSVVTGSNYKFLNAFTTSDVKVAVSVSLSSTTALQLTQLQTRYTFYTNQTSGLCQFTLAGQPTTGSDALQSLAIYFTSPRGTPRYYLDLLLMAPSVEHSPSRTVLPVGCDIGTDMSLACTLHYGNNYYDWTWVDPYKKYYVLTHFGSKAQEFFLVPALHQG